jgi:hypothetical protein
MVVESLSEAGYLLRQTIRNPKITFGDTFYTTMQTAVVPLSPLKTRVHISFSVEFVKSCIFKSTIQRASISGAQKGCQKEIEIIKRLISGADEPEIAQSLSVAAGGLISGGSGAVLPSGGHLISRWMVFFLFALLAATLCAVVLLLQSTQHVIALQIVSQAAQGRLMMRIVDVLELLADDARPSSVGVE